MTPVERLISFGAAVMGLYAVVRNRTFAEASVAASENHFGVRLREGTRAYRFNWIFSRSMAIGVGTLLMIGGFLGAFGIDWRDVYR